MFSLKSCVIIIKISWTSKSRFLLPWSWSWRSKMSSGRGFRLFFEQLFLRSLPGIETGKVFLGLLLNPKKRRNRTSKKQSLTLSTKLFTFSDSTWNFVKESKSSKRTKIWMQLILLYEIIMVRKKNKEIRVKIIYCILETMVFFDNWLASNCSKDEAKRIWDKVSGLKF